MFLQLRVGVHDDVKNYKEGYLFKFYCIFNNKFFENVKEGSIFTPLCSHTM